MNRKYPWYDSNWLTVYMVAKDFIRQNHPHKLDEFVHAFDVLRTDPEFKIKHLPQLFDESIISDLKTVIQESWQNDTEIHEYGRFGRLVIHDHPLAIDLQKRITPLVSEMVNEEVEPCYNFLSLYSDPGVCAIHMDAPQAKWTVDFCIEQSTAWPIHFSKVVPWPEEWTDRGEQWSETIISDPANQFESQLIGEGDAIIFSGSSQWHYRNPIERKHAKNFCHLLFFHYVPAGIGELLKPASWAGMFGIPELANLENPYADVHPDLNFS